MKIAAVTGCFDILHIGHLRLIKFAAQNADFVLIGLNSDKSIQLLSQYVVTLPQVTPINLNTASIEVLMAISPSISREDAEKITLARVMQPFKSSGEFLKLLQSAVSSGSQMVLDNSQIDVKSQFWLAQSDIELGRSHFLNVTLIQRTDNLPEKGNSTQVIWTQLSNSIRP